MIEVKDIAEYEDSDSELAKYTISKLSSEKKELQQRIDRAIEYICFIEHNLEKSEEVGNEGINHFSIALNKVYQLKYFLLKGSEE